MDINKLKFDILGNEMLYLGPSSDLFTNNRSTLRGGVLLYVRDMFNANKLVNLSVMLEHLETISVSF